MMEALLAMAVRETEQLEEQGLFQLPVEERERGRQTSAGRPGGT